MRLTARMLLTRPIHGAHPTGGDQLLDVVPTDLGAHQLIGEPAR